MAFWLLALRHAGTGWPTCSHTGHLDHHSGGNLHGHKLLEQKLAGVRNLDQRHLRLVLAAAALECLCREVCNGNETTQVAHVHTVLVTAQEHALLEEVGRTVGDHAIALHLTEAQTTLTRTTLGRLTGQVLCGAACSRVDLVVHHVLQALVVRQGQEHLGVDLAPSVPVVHHLVAAQVVAVLLQHLRDTLHSHTLVERRGITFLSLLCADLTQQSLRHVPDGHTRGNGVRVHDNVRRNPFAAEGHVLRAVLDTACTFLTVTTGKLVSDLGDAHLAHTHLAELVALLVDRKHDAVNNTLLTLLQTLRRIPLSKPPVHDLQAVSIVDDWLRHSHDDVTTAHACAGCNDTIVIQLFVHLVAHALNSATMGLLE
eukprot:comp24071_c0_seq1/m.43308 comp24071_c0_seq1/g.43308  ORF comp24071_c0_seq1/g.43308 comp24071_c0_seq1/m.43308 type:complete len:370 (+) comp24071_c0_seq1:731-1840(+)